MNSFFHRSETCEDPDKNITKSSSPPITFDSLQRRRSSIHHHLPSKPHSNSSILPQSIAIANQQPTQLQQFELRSESKANASRSSSNHVFSYYNKTDPNSNCLDRTQLRSQYSRSSNSLYHSSSADEQHPQSSSASTIKAGSSISLAMPNVITITVQRLKIHKQLDNLLILFRNRNILIKYQL